MPRKRTLSEDDEWEKAVEEAVGNYKSGKYSSLREAARVTGIHRKTITERLRGQPTCRKAHEGSQRLAHIKEDEVARAI